MNKIRVLEVVGSMDMGGAETFLMNVLRNIDRKRFQLYFLVYGQKHFDYENEIKRLGGIIIRVRKPKKMFDFGLINIIKKKIEEYDIDIVHAHTNHNSAYAVLAARGVNRVKKIIVHSHTAVPEQRGVIKKIYYRITKFIINKYATLFLACGKDAGRSLFYKKNTFTIINNGIIVEDFKYSLEYRKQIRKELGIDDDIIAVVSVGRMDKNKNHKYLIDIFRVFVKEKPNSVLYIIGDGVLKNRIIKQIKDYGLDNKVFLLGKRSDVNKVLSAMDILVFPSMHEGLPVTLIEAQTNGIPIVASSGIDNDVDFTNSIDFLSVHSPCKEWASVMKKRACERYDNYDIALRSEYNITTNVFKLEEIYEKD